MDRNAKQFFGQAKQIAERRKKEDLAVLSKRNPDRMKRVAPQLRGSRTRGG